MTTYTADSPPPCPDCGGQLTERTEPNSGDVDDLLYAYRCPGCDWEDAGGYDYRRLTIADAPWTLDLWALVEQERADLARAWECVGIERERADAAEAERDAARRDLARIVQLCGWDCDGNDPEIPAGAIHLYADAVQAVRELREEHAEAQGEARAADLHRALNRRCAESLDLTALRIDPQTGDGYLPSWHDMPERIVALREGCDLLHQLCSDAASYLDDLDTGSGDAMAVRLRAAAAQQPRPMCGAVVRERTTGTTTVRTLCPLPPGHDGEHAEALAGDDAIAIYGRSTK